MTLQSDPQFKYILRLLSKSNYHSADLQRRLEARGADEVLIRSILEYFSAMGAINDQNFIERKVYKLMCSGFSKQYIVHKLQEQNLECTSELIDTVYSRHQYSEAHQINQLKEHYKRKKNLPEITDQNPGLLRFLASKGHFTHP